MHPFEAAIAASWPTDRWQDVTVLIAVSGGADSVALLRALHALRPAHEHSSPAGRLVVAHFNHGWRGDESEGDAKFVRVLARRLQLPVYVGGARPRDPSGTGHAADRREDAARRLRYRFLTDLATRLGARYVATAHTADDQAETVLQRVLRGTGLSGLRGIPRVRRLTTATALLRPMLGVPRAEVLAYLESIQQPFRTDPSNLDRRYTRNRIRQELLPLARDYYAGVDEALRRLASLAGEAQRVIDQQAEALLEEAIVERSPLTTTLDLGKFAGIDRYLIREALRHLWQQRHWPRQAMGLAEWNELASLASLLNGPPKRRLPRPRHFPAASAQKNRAGCFR